MQQITPQQLKSWLDDETRAKPILLDVREPWEYENCHIPESLLMPMRSIPARAMELDRDAETVVICHHGGRSMQVAMFLERNGFSSLYNLMGGVNGWAISVDPGMPRY